MSPLWLLVPAAYLVGQFPTAQLIGRLTRHDPHREGSGNPGASNMYRLAGKKAGFVVLVGDVLKGLVPALVGLLVDGRPLGVACGIAATVGHILPAVRRFRGGKGVATVGGLTLATNPVVGVVILCIWAALARLLRVASVASLSALVLLPIGVLLRDRETWEILAFVAIAALVVIRHWSNIKRLLRRQENALRRSIDQAG